jgi:hypothetical protein
MCIKKTDPIKVGSAGWMEKGKSVPDEIKKAGTENTF